MIYFLIYLASIIDDCKGITILLCIFIPLLTPLLIGTITDCLNEDIATITKKVCKICIPIWIIAIIFFMLIPPKATIYQCLALHYGQKLSTSFKLDDKLKKVSTIIDLNLDKNIEDLSKTLK